MSLQRGLFLAFEGVEGSGKSTQVGQLAEWLRGRGLEVEVAREPGSTPLGERVRSLVLDQTDLGVPARSELFLMLAARAAFVEQVVRPALAGGRVVIADRFELSTLAYQGAGRGLPVEEVVRCNRFATGGLEPDATLLLDLPPEEGARRQADAGKRLDRVEREEADFHRRVAWGYRELAGSIANVLRVDARGSVDQVRGRVLEALAARYPETFPPEGVTK
jgi:dTMP kinase